MYLDYKECAKANGHLSTGIHTRISSTQRISSIYRIYSNPHFEQWAWETFLWEEDKIAREYDTLWDVEDVVNLHCEIVSEYNIKGEKYGKEIR
ncbi:MAG: hypothetical protein PHX04_06875 [Bacilli bacterium]|nr:hypothetical protein [Bacilli bacterium]